MYSLKIILAFTAILITSLAINAQTPKIQPRVSYNPNAEKDTLKRSIKSLAVGKIGNAKITISYHSPGVRKRIIWGGLVPYDEVWVTGAHTATSLQITKSFVAGGRKIPPGKYAFFTIPGENEWIIIINKNWQQHLTDDYNVKDDIVRIKVKPKKHDTVIERLQYFINDKGNRQGIIAVAWEKLRIELPILIRD